MAATTTACPILPRGCDSHDAHARSGWVGGDSQVVVPVLGSDPGV